MRIFFVVSLTDDDFPPIIPQSASTFSLSAITISLLESSYVLSSSATKVSPSFAKRTQIVPTIVSASKI